MAFRGTQSDVRFILILLTCSLAANVFLAYRVLKGPGSARRTLTPAEYSEWFASQPRHDLNLGLEADVAIVEFSDFQCPACRRASEIYVPVVKRLQAEHPGRVKFLTKDFPLEVECNPGVKKDLHPAACEAAAAVRLVGRRGKGDELVRWLFANQAALTSESVWDAAAALSEDANIKEGYALALREVAEDVALGIRLDVRGTPALFVNGAQIGTPPAEIFEAIVREELIRASTPGARGAP